MFREIIQEIINSIGKKVKENEEGIPEEDITIHDLNPCPIDDHSTYGISS